VRTSSAETTPNNVKVRRAHKVSNSISVNNNNDPISSAPSTILVETNNKNGVHKRQNTADNLASTVSINNDYK